MNWLRTPLMEGEGGGAGAGSGAGAGTGGGSTTLLSGGAGAGAGGGQQQQSQQQQFTPSYEGAIDLKTGTFAEGWTAKAFGAEYGDGPLSRVKSIPELRQVLHDNIEAARGKVPSAPTDKSTPEQLAAWRKLVGAPADVKEYGDLRPESIPAELWDTESAGKLAAIAHKHHLPPAAIKEVVGLYAESLDAAVKQNEAGMQTHMAGELTKLRQEFGKDFDSNMHAAKRMALTLGGDIEKDPVFRSASVVSMMAKMARMVGEDKLVNGATQGLQGTPKMQANAIMTDKTHPLYEKYQKGDADTVSLVTNLLAQGG
jgi:hypothetical protein